MGNLLLEFWTEVDVKPGPELDALIAKKVMGWTLGKSDDHYYLMDGRHIDRRVGTGWSPSTNITHAFEVVEKVGPQFEIIYQPNGRWLARFGNTIQAEADTAPHAICLAALKAVGGGA